MKITEFDKTKEFENKIEPMIRELIKTCKFYEVPLFVTACTKSEKEKTSYRNFHVSTAINNQNLTDDQIRKHILIANGFDAIQPGTCMEIMSDGMISDGTDSQEV